MAVMFSKVVLYSHSSQLFQCGAQTQHMSEAKKHTVPWASSIKFPVTPYYFPYLAFKKHKCFHTCVQYKFGTVNTVFKMK